MGKNAKAKINSDKSIIMPKSQKKLRLIAKHSKRSIKLFSTKGLMQTSNAAAQLIDSRINRQGQISCFYHIENKILMTKYSKEILRLHNNFQEVRVALPKVFCTKSVCLFDREIILKQVDKYMTIHQCEEETFFLTSSIIDKFLNNVTISKLTKRDFNLIGLTAFFIASKMEDMYPLCLVHIQSNIGKNEFSASEIIEKELEILNEIDFDLDYVSVYEVIRTYFCDFVVQLKETDMLNDLNEVFPSVYFSSVLFAKICETDEYLKSTPIQIKAICCIILSHDYELSKNEFQITDKRIKCFKGWFGMLIKQSGTSRESIQYVYNYLKILFHNISGTFERRSKKNRLHCGQ